MINIDFSGYAYSFTQEPENIHIMRKWEGDDPGINNQKTPTILLLTPNKVCSAKTCNTKKFSTHFTRIQKSFDRKMNVSPFK